MRIDVTAKKNDVLARRGLIDATVQMKQSTMIS